jgi:hypothetical protein
MAYNKFTLEKVIEQFGVKLKPLKKLFPYQVETIEPSEILKQILERNLPISRSYFTEKSLSELLISPILIELRELRQRQISIFSGIEFNVDNGKGLNGRCDFIIAGNDNQYFLDAPILTIVEAKKGIIDEGYGQCIAEMIAAQIFNAKKGITKKVFGCVTNGHSWEFMFIEENIVYIEQNQFQISDAQDILSYLFEMTK